MFEQRLHSRYVRSDNDKINNVDHVVSILPYHQHNEDSLAPTRDDDRAYNHRDGEQWNLGGFKVGIVMQRVTVEAHTSTNTIGTTTAASIITNATAAITVAAASTTTDTITIPATKSTATTVFAALITDITTTLLTMLNTTRHSACDLPQPNTDDDAGDVDDIFRQREQKQAYASRPRLGVPNTVNPPLNNGILGTCVETPTP